MDAVPWEIQLAPLLISLVERLVLLQVRPLFFDGVRGFGCTNETAYVLSNLNEQMDSIKMPACGYIQLNLLCLPLLYLLG